MTANYDHDEVHHQKPLRQTAAKQQQNMAVKSRNCYTFDSVVTD